MDNKQYMKIADKISNELILLSKQQKRYKMSTLQLYQELINKKYHKYLDEQYQILAYLIESLTIKGYEIIDNPYFNLKKY